MPDRNGPRPRQRRAGVLIPLFSIRTRTGWGLGEIPDLVALARWAARSGIRVVQMLPVCAVSGRRDQPLLGRHRLRHRSGLPGSRRVRGLRGGGRARGAARRGSARLLDELAAAPAVAWQRLRPLKERAMRLAFAQFRAEEWPRRSRARAAACPVPRGEPATGSTTTPCSPCCTPSSSGTGRNGPGPGRRGGRRRWPGRAEEHADEILYRHAGSSGSSTSSGGRRAPRRRPWAWT